MRNNLIKVGIFTVALILFAPAESRALTLESFSIKDDPLTFSTKEVSTITTTNKNIEKSKEEVSKPVASPPEAPAAPPVVTYTVVAGDSLSKISTDHNTTWVRLFNKNSQIANPDILQAGEIITIPAPEEVLAERPLPEPVAPQAADVATSAMPARLASRTQSASSSAGNTYAPGYCTWYAKNRRPDLPNRMGNAISWVSSAASLGFATGSAPRSGAIGQQGNHVVYVESVNGDGTVTVSEMNYKGLFVVSSRTVPASNFSYIY
jgi:surface antigen